MVRIPQKKHLLKVSIRVSNWTPFLEKSWSPLPGKCCNPLLGLLMIIVILEINHWTPSLNKLMTKKKKREHARPHIRTHARTHAHTHTHTQRRQNFFLSVGPRHPLLRFLKPHLHKRLAIAQACLCIHPAISCSTTCYMKKLIRVTARARYLTS